MKIVSFLYERARAVVGRRRDLLFRKYLDRLVSRGLRLGKGVSFQDGIFLDPEHCFLIAIGDDCVFAPNVRIVAHDASTKFVVGHTKLGRVTIGNRCFLGDSVLVLPGVEIGDDCIIGAGSVVVKSIPARSVAAGNPAKVIMSIDEYRARQAAGIGAGAVYSSEYHIGHLTDEKRREILAAVDRGPTYIE
jgi:maltose O-acetyltransferase